jgi:hypothetical protein
MCTPGLLTPQTQGALGALMSGVGIAAAAQGRRQGLAGAQGAVNAEKGRQAGYDAQLAAARAPLFNAPGIASPTVPGFDAQTAGVVPGFAAGGGAAPAAAAGLAAGARSGRNVLALAAPGLSRQTNDTTASRVATDSGIIRAAADRSMRPLQSEMRAGATRGLNLRTLGTAGTLFGTPMVNRSFYAGGQAPAAAPAAASTSADDQFDPNADMLGRKRRR